MAPATRFADLASSSKAVNTRDRTPAGFMEYSSRRDPPKIGRQRRKVAIVGSGCAGLGAAWALKHTDCEVHIFEREPRLGGHTNTATWASPHQPHRKTPVDTGFIVMNSATYPNFIKFLKEVDVHFTRTEMTFAVSRDQGKFEWSGSGRGIFAQRRNFFRLQHWRMIFDIVRFNQYALDLLSDTNEEAKSITIGEYLNRHGYCQAFKDDYLIPMTAAVWSTSPDKASLEFPAQTLIRFLWNHHLLSTVARRPDWLTIAGGSKEYIDAILKSFPKGQLHVHPSSEVVRLVRHPHDSGTPVQLYWRSKDDTLAHLSGAKDAVSDSSFDHVIMACHGDQVWPILSGDKDAATRQDSTVSASLPTPDSESSSDEKRMSISEDATLEEYDIFKAFQTTENTCYLHNDLKLMPTRTDTWSSWNYLISSEPSKRPHPAGVSLTYNMNILQHIPRDLFGDVLVTMNPGVAPSSADTQGFYTYRHPLYTVEAVRAQEKLEKIQNARGVSYCGAWTKYGFHEDGFSSGLKVAMDHLGAKLPFEFVDSTYSRGHTPALNLADYALRFVIQMLMIVLRLCELAMGLPTVAWLSRLVGAFAFYFVDMAERRGFIA